jgi:hypothetical protein
MAGTLRQITRRSAQVAGADILGWATFVTGCESLKKIPKTLLKACKITLVTNSVVSQ